jgi:hypothetical protein
VVPDSDRFWLKDLLIPDRNMTVTIEYDDFSITRDQGVFRPITASDVEGRHIVVNGPSWGREGELTIVFTERDMADGWPKFQELYRGGNTLLYQLWNGEQYYIAFGDEISTDRWLISDDGYRIRRVKVKYYEVKRPDVIKPGKFLPPPKV